MDRKKSLQQIVLNRIRFNSIEFETQHVELMMRRGRDYTFPIRITNYGAPTQIYLSASPEIEDDIRFLRNDFVAIGRTTIDVVAHIQTQRHGSISVTVGYGANTESFDIDLLAEPDQGIEVDLSLAIPGKVNRYQSPQMHKTAALKAVGALMFILVILTLFTGVVPGYVGTLSAILLLVIIITYFLAPHVR